MLNVGLGCVARCVGSYASAATAAAAVFTGIGIVVCSRAALGLHRAAPVNQNSVNPDCAPAGPSPTAGARASICDN
jgi:hypothetical protein